MMTMKKTILIFALFLGLLITSSGFNRTGLNTAIGKLAPEIASFDIEQVIKNSEKQGRYVLLSFWSSSDGQSRRKVNEYDLWLSDHIMANLDMVAINFDQSEGLFREIVRRDGLSASSQFNVGGNTARQIIRDYHLDDGYGSILISPNGQIIAHNPTVGQLADVTGL